MSAVWSDAQRRCLDALGFVLYDVATPDDAPALTQEPERAPRPAAARPPRTTSAIPARPRATATLHDAVLGAATRVFGSADAAKTWLASPEAPPLAGLREPAAKRALWARLRQLRRERSPP